MYFIFLFLFSAMCCVLHIVMLCAHSNDTVVAPISSSTCFIFQKLLRLPLAAYNNEKEIEKEKKNETHCNKYGLCILYFS